MSDRDEHIRALALFGSHVRILVGAPIGTERRPPELAAIEIEALLRRLHGELTRFDADSALSRLNADPKAEVATTPAVALLVESARRAAVASGGLVDAAQIGALEGVGYAASRVNSDVADFRSALASAPARRAAVASDASRWDEVRVNLEAATVRRPPGMRIDSGGLGKGLAADLAAGRLKGYSSFAVDCGGDIRIGGSTKAERVVQVVHPFGPDETVELRLRRGGIATSGIRTRIWKQREGYSHHLLDPATGTPAWTGVVQATALAPTAVQAETLAKAAVLAGPARGSDLLEEHGGLVVLDSGETVAIGDVPFADRREAAAVM